MAVSALSDLNALLRGHLEGLSADIPPPPYHVRVAGFIYAVTELDRDAVVQLLPPELEASDNNTGTMGLFNAPNGFGIAPYSAFFVGIQVKGFKSSDGSPGIFMATGYYSNRAGIVMHRDYNTHLVDGQARLWQEDDSIIGEAGPADTSMVRLTVKRPTEAGPARSGVHNYLGRNRNGGINLYGVSFTGILPPVEVVSFEVFQHAPERLRLMRPRSVPYASYTPNMTLTYGAPRTVLGPPVEEDPAPSPTALLQVLSQLDRAAIIVDRDGKVLHANAVATDLLGENAPHVGARIHGASQSEQADLEAMISAAALDAPGRLLEPTGLRRTGGSPIIVQAIPIQWRKGDGPTVLLLLSDPARALKGESAATLQILGLTRAEARIAALVGIGHSPREAADMIGVTENTARSTLQRVFEKLSIRKQSELANIVARLEA